MIVEQKSAGRDLQAAQDQVYDYILYLKPEERPQYILVCDFQNFILIDLETREEHSFTLDKIHKNVHLFHFISGRNADALLDQAKVNIEAAKKMAKLHKTLEDSGYEGHSLEVFLIRILFCLFADDSGIFDRDTLHNYLVNRTSKDGSDLGPKLIKLFQVLDTPKDKRQKKLDKDLHQFEYINGKLFSERIDTPDMDSELRDILLDCSRFDWSHVAPAIFGSLFQSVMLPEKQRQDGAHYTSETNILKVIEPLFLDNLRAELDEIAQKPKVSREHSLRAFQKKLRELTCFDPACGCGNFLIVVYRELRLLEI